MINFKFLIFRDEFVVIVFTILMKKWIFKLLKMTVGKWDASSMVLRNERWWKRPRKAQRFD